MAVPPTVRDAVLARTSRLEAPARGVLEAVAVIPPRAELWLLDEVVPDETFHLDACLAAGLLFPRVARCRFGTSSPGARSSSR